MRALECYCCHACGHTARAALARVVVRSTVDLFVDGSGSGEQAEGGGRKVQAEPRVPQMQPPGEDLRALKILVVKLVVMSRRSLCQIRVAMNLTSVVSDFWRLRPLPSKVKESTRFPLPIPFVFGNESVSYALPVDSL